MREFENKRTSRKILYSKFTAVMLIIILFLMANAIFGIAQKTKENKNQLNLELAKLSELEEKKIEVEGQILFTQSDIGREEQIRNKFSLAKVDEYAVFIIDEEPEIEPEIEPTGLSGFWNKMTNWINF